jgi:hypothetical protein
MIHRAHNGCRDGIEPEDISTCGLTGNFLPWLMPDLRRVSGSGFPSPLRTGYGQDHAPLCAISPHGGQLDFGSIRLSELSERVE